MTSAEINFLQSAEGTALLRQYGDYDDDALFQLLRKSAKQEPIPFLGAVVTLIKLRRKAAGKFSRSGEMFFTPLSLEQSTDEKIARHIAARFQSDWRVADLTCGLGGNAIFLAEHCCGVVAVDINPDNLACARENAKVYGVVDKLEFIEGDALVLAGNPSGPLNRIDAFFLDPARDREGKTKTRSILNSRPALLELLPQLMGISKNIGVKISPAFDYQELELLPEQPELEVISEEGVVKVVMLWFGELKTAKRRATIFSGDKQYNYSDGSRLNNIPIVAAPLQYLYELDKAISKAHLVEEAAEPYGLAQLNTHLSFLTGNKLIGENEPGLWRTFKVLDHGHFSWKNLQKLLKDKKITRANVVVKRFPLLPEEIYKKLKIKEGGDLFLILTVFSTEERSYILAERVSPLKNQQEN
jgi:SAM-dependent methyltransferase